VDAAWYRASAFSIETVTTSGDSTFRRIVSTTAALVSAIGIVRPFAHAARTRSR
jgi:hypothetical protein